MDGPGGRWLLLHGTPLTPQVWDGVAGICAATDRSGQPWRRWAWGSVSLSGHLTRLDSTGELIGGDATHPADHRRNAVIFGAACRSCPLRQRCTTAKHGRTLHLHEHEGLLRTARAEWAGLRRDYMTPRPQVERAIAQVATRRGRRFSSLPRSDQ